MSSPRGVLFVHAHPDDESCATGGAIAHHVALGDRVTVVTCTRGEQGRIAVPELARLAADRDDELGPYRAGELRRALPHLGVTDHRFLVEEGRYRDSGRLGLDSNDRPDAFWQADLDEAGGWLAGVIDEIRPEIVVTYDPNGGYGHPDHIQTHRVTMRALALAEHKAARVYWCAVPRERIQAELEALAVREAGGDRMWINTDPADYPDGVHDEAEISVDLDVSDVWERKRAALGEHRTQLTIVDDCWVLASGRGNPIQRTEWFIRVAPTDGGFEPVEGLERAEEL